MVKVENEIPLRIAPNGNPFLTGPFAPVNQEITADDLSVVGEIPKTSLVSICGTDPTRFLHRAGVTTGLMVTGWSTLLRSVRGRQRIGTAGYTLEVSSLNKKLGRQSGRD
jgi:hypothetical protein